ncbi:glycosyltransferase family 4 protein [Paractinoplanes ferrugineus]|uniref:Glycosyltransferase WbuB n=1 Tax=Paractinoplanes ferrugineus TaxID=113564 RepID=A0A919J6K8_9ACTN|nr:glycosyltransferase family 4 protein [Actinoplanes ferrugineus]GIE15806.1 glycosyltransferase WbuB [Actinoplanes ferrugineus]
MSKPIRVLLMVENVPLGRDHRLRKHAAALVAAGMQVTVICRKDPANRENPAVRVLDYPASDGVSKLGFVREYAWSLTAAAWLTLRAMLSGGVDVVQVSSTPDIYFVLAAPLKLFRRRVIFDFKDLSPEIYEARYGRADGLMYKLLRRFERASLRTADHVVAVNSSVRSVALDRGGLGADRVTVVGNGPWLADLGSRPAQPTLKRGHRHLCALVGMMGPQDGIDLALAAIDHLVHRIGRTDTAFTFAGIGDYLPVGLRFVEERGLSGWVSFPGWLSRDEVYDLLSTADVGLEPNLEEFVTPVKAMEYMAFGLPFVAFDVAETRIIGEGAAELVPRGDVVAFAERIDTLLRNPERRAELGAAGERAVRQRLSWDRQQVPYLGVIARLTHEKLTSGGTAA